MSATPAERMRKHRARRLVDSRREVRLNLSDACDAVVRERVADAVIGLNIENEQNTFDWIEAVSDFDENPSR
jgi:hypothetical protein